MEEYTFKLTRTSIKYGKFKDKVYNLHFDKYGKESADRILEKSTEILKDAIIQKNNSTINNNSLIIGKVQSGKTSNLEMISALAFDNAFNLLIIYGGYDNTLLDQCVKRFSKVFDPNGDNEDVHIVSTEDRTIKVVDRNFFETCMHEKTPVIMIGLKRPSGLVEINNVLSKLDIDKVNALIIDDEGDQASLNVAKDKKNEASSTYAAIKNMKDILRDPIYFPVTATPMANVFLPDLSVLKPDKLHLVYPAKDYTGAEVFHLLEDRIENVTKNDLDSLDEGRIPKSLETALEHFILASSILLKEGIKKSCMIVHSYREVSEQETVYEIVSKYFEMCLYNLENGYESITFNSLVNSYNELIDETTKDKYTIEDLKEEIITVIKSAKVVKRNSANKSEEDSLKHYRYVVHIGGDLLQRGITFDNLVTTYFTRWSESGNMDTSLQRARWFGYRQSYLSLCKVFLPEKVKMEFANLASIENDLWDQFEQIEKGELSIEDIVIDAEDTSLKPTRRNAVDIKKIGFTRKWFNQRIGIFDLNQIKKTKESFEKLIEHLEIIDTSAGRTDDKKSARYVKVNSSDFIDFVVNNDFLFNQSPFSVADLKHVLNDEEKINIVLMYDGPRKKERIRSFSDGKISALQQGADSLNESDMNYLGDAYVIPERNLVTVQAFRIVPKINNELEKEHTQYMYSIHVPQKRVSYVRG